MMMRKLDYWEAFLYMRYKNSLGDGGYLVVTKLEGELDDAILQQALHLLFKKQPMLRARVVEIEKDYWFKCDVQFSDISMPLISVTSKEQLEDVIATEADNFLPAQKYLWRLSVVCHNNCGKQAYYLILNIHHSIMDALASFTFTKDLLHYYSVLMDGKDINIKSLPLIPSQSELINPSYCKRILPSQGSCNSSGDSNVDWLKFKFSEYAPISGRKTGNIFKTIDENTMQKLKNASKEHGVTINSVLNAALLTTIQQLEGGNTNTFILSPINARQSCDPKLITDYVNNCAAPVMTYYPNLNDSTDFWELAKLYNDKLMAAFRDFVFHPKRAFDKDSLEEYLATAYPESSNHFNLSYDLSNMGVISLPDDYDDKFKLKSVRFYPIRKTASYPIFILVYSWLGRMHFCFSYTEPLLSRDFVEHFIEVYLHSLSNL